MNTNENDSGWSQLWEQTVRQHLPADVEANAEFRFARYNEVITKTKAGPAELATASVKLWTSWMRYRRTVFADTSARGMGDLNVEFIVKWFAKEQLQRKLKNLVKEEIDSFQPDWVLAHSFGTLITYDYFSEQDDAEAGPGYITFGSQISHPALREMFGGRLTMPKPLRQWFNLYNAHDKVFVSPIDILDSTLYEELNADFDTPSSAGVGGLINHDFDRYLSHPNVVDRVWSKLQPESQRVARTFSFNMPSLKVGADSLQMSTLRAEPTLVEKPTATNRALLIGINEYQDPKLELAGCRNDVFTMSAILQESGMQPDEIRVVFDHRATASALRERLTWLLADPKPGDVRFLYFSGHGAQLPVYNASAEFDGYLECLVPHDFDGTEEKAITDVFLKELYSQLPYDTNLTIVLDCCHSGGASRSGLRVRGVQLEDDIMHRALKWDRELGMWIKRDRQLFGRASKADHARNQRFAGHDLQTYRLGCAVDLRLASEAKTDDLNSRKGHKGHYMPVVVAACQEDQLAFEYAHGASHHGAFTFALAKQLRDGKITPYRELAGVLKEVLVTAGYPNQDPDVRAPSAKLDEPIPYFSDHNKVSSKQA